MYVFMYVCKYETSETETQKYDTTPTNIIQQKYISNQTDVHLQSYHHLQSQQF